MSPITKGEGGYYLISLKGKKREKYNKISKEKYNKISKVRKEE